MDDMQLYYILEPEGCWHKWEWIPGAGVRCKNCDIDLYGKENHSYVMKFSLSENPDFSTWNGFGWLWEHVKNWETEKSIDFFSYLEEDTRAPVGFLPAYYLNPARFRDTLKKFLGKKNR